MTTSVAISAVDDRGKRVSIDLLDRIFPAPRSFAIRLWDGTLLGADGPSSFTIVLNSRGALRRMFRPPLDMGIGESYVRGDFDIDGDLVEAVSALSRLAAPRRASQLADIARLWFMLPTDRHRSDEVGFAPAELRAAVRSREWEMSAIQYHYDLGNDFYELFLGRQMVYTAAYFTDRSQTLDDAQAQKLDHVCRKLRLRPGERLLDIGCGWGALLIHAAKHYGVHGLGVTLSEQQHELAKRRIHAAGLSDRVDVRVQDYRDLRETPFDKVSGIGIFEHVGRAGLEEYFGQAYRMLKPGGLFINHGIAVRMPPARETGLGHAMKSALRNVVLGSTGFRRKYLWPNGDLVPLSVATTVAEQTGFQVCDIENLRPHYVLTLIHWRRNMDAARDEALRIGGEAMYRLWRLFLAFAEYQFRSGAQTVNQVLMLKQSPDGDHPLPLTRDDLARTLSP